MASYIPEYITLNVVASTFLVVAFLALLFGSIISIFEGLANDFFTRVYRNTLFLVAYSYPIALVAYIAGYLSSEARTSGIAQLLPAVLALMGAVNLYVFGADNRYRVVISYCICIFAGMLFLWRVQA